MIGVEFRAREPAPDADSDAHASRRDPPPGSWPIVAPRHRSTRKSTAATCSAWFDAGLDQREVQMAIQERVTSYSVSVVRNDFVAYREAVRLTTETGSEIFLGFVTTPPAEWLQINGPNAIVFLERTQFDRIHHLVQSESPLFVTTMQGIFGLVFNLSTSPELPGEGPGDDDALAQLAAQLRAG
jgi:hypothetical protein